MSANLLPPEMQQAAVEAIAGQRGRLLDYTLSVRPSNGGDYCLVVDEAGRICACGGKWLCERVAAGRPIVIEQGSLFDV